MHTARNRNDPQRYKQRDSDEDLSGTQLSTSPSVDREDQERDCSEGNVDGAQTTGADYATLKYQIGFLPLHVKK